ncbi:ATP-dependent RNA helicase DBP7 [Frankliniella fusca]|uniref:ATP-dependent RNA helicase DBP7 n=1 Tax=Frankliniella fusca TaxID=407009 RepID=A0AAE1H108_9NEOP|nr:ATP-dependent RNA helicase DBP7 [Frankliniella fusca]
MEDSYDTQGRQDELTHKSRKISSSRKKSLVDETSSLKEKGEKRTKKRKGSDSLKKHKKDENLDAKINLSRFSSDTPDSELRLDQSDSPVTDDVFEGSNSSQESNELLTMSALLKSVLDQKKRLLFETDEVQQFFIKQIIKKEQ